MRLTAGKTKMRNVTLVAIDGTNDPRGTIRSVEDAMKLAVFDEVRVFVAAETPTSEEFSKIRIKPLDKNGYNRFCLQELHKHVTTSHCLTIQADSRITNPRAWNQSWLDYDYIGAPWPDGWSLEFDKNGLEYRVGNSGFCLRSQRLLKATASIPIQSVLWQQKEVKGIVVDDALTCIRYREQLEKAGMKFAPVSVAAKFSFELPTAEAPKLNGQFGVHHV